MTSTPSEARISDMTSTAVFPAQEGVESRPLVTVVVPTYNRGQFLERCARSILDQSYARVECVVMDGASTDNTVAILQRLAQADSRLRFVSQPDRGEVDATNRGFELAQGEIIGTIGSDDFYVPDAVEKAVEYLLAHRECIGVSGDGLYVDPMGEALGRGVITYRGVMSKDRIRRILMVRYASCFVCHGSFFGWRSRLLALGKFDPDYWATSDWDYYLRVLAAGERIGCLPRVQYRYTVHPDMGAYKHWSKAEAQRKQFHNRYGMKWRHELFRSTIGRLISYLSNPHRSPLIKGIRRELLEALARRKLRKV